ncbi:cupin domain-containing protein [Denitrobaculum tricleocarpae]|uniref:Cupin domain-containing protein n=2 Tax=Denitrobaculum tricleocarpae TaxID=2591009 RepID=A0A545TUT4_9PROT|nr:cupin domain-containing protein [Denitrobaculum tricleocarpae]
MERALAAGVSPQGLRATQSLARGSMKLYFYAPRGEDLQTPHDQDEIYVVLKGSGSFTQIGDEAVPESLSFGPGDAIFVPAGREHRFENFSDDFETWVIMYGVSGGES